MPDLIQLLAGGGQPGSYVESGAVVAGLGGSLFTVRVNGIEYTAEATIDSTGLTTGARVVINRTGSGRYIIGATRQFEKQQPKEIVIDG